MTALLDGKQEQALNHIFRRRILRAIHAAAHPLSPKQLCSHEGALPEVPLSTVAYHMQALVKYGMVSEHHTEARRGATEHFFTSEVAGDPLVNSVLSEAEELDAAKRDGGGE